MIKRLTPRTLEELEDRTTVPTSGRHIVASHDEYSIVLYQTFGEEIADFVVRNGYLGGPGFDTDRETWFKLSFLWTMHTSNWATIQGKQRVLAISMEKHLFQHLLDLGTNGEIRHAPFDGIGIASDDMCLQWTPDCDGYGEQMKRQTLLIGLKGILLEKINSKYIEAIEDITDFVKQQRQCVQNDNYRSLLIPTEKLFVPDNIELCKRIMLGDFEVNSVKTTKPCEKTGEQARQRAPYKLALFLQGAFNPVHTQHVQIMIECKAYIEANTPYFVQAGVMAVNPDHQVREKLSAAGEAHGSLIKSVHRDKMCQLSVLSNPWILTYEMGRYSREQIAADITERLGKGLQWFSIFGADRAIEQCSKPLFNSIFVGREGITKRLEQTFNKACKDGVIKPGAVYILPTEMPDISSTFIRQNLGDMKTETVKAKKYYMMYSMIRKGWLDRYVGNYLVENESQLYKC